MTAREAISMIRSQLSAAGIEELAAESFIILEWICGIDRGTYYMDPDAVIPENTMEILESVLAKRAEHVPLQYLMGTCEFMGYTFYVDERVLIPRQDTECLVEYAADLIRRENMISGRDCPAGTEMEKSSVPQTEVPEILDLCTGSGCIGISIKKLCPKAQVTLADLSEDALTVAGYNAEKLSAKVSLVQGDLFENIGRSYDYILSNPPYIPTDMIDTLMPEVKDYEPRLALDGTEDGLAFYRRIIREAKEYLKPCGRLIFEIGMDQGEDVVRLLESEGYRETEIRQDLSGLDRIVSGRR